MLRGAEIVDHGEDEFFDLLGLNLGLGEELGGAKAELGHVSFGDLAAGVDDEREGVQGGRVAEPLDEREAVSVGEGEIENEQVGGAGDALADGLLAGGRMFYVDGGVLEAGDDYRGEIFIVLDEEDVNGTF